MATIARGAKTGGGTDFNVGQAMKSAEFNTDFNTIVTDYNGNITTANISASAAIPYSKLSLASSVTSSDLVDGTIVNADINASADITATKIGDSSATDDAHDDTTDPGISNAHALPTTIEGELKQLRYVAERQALGIAAGRFDATGTIEATYWGDFPVRNLQRIPGINGVVVAGLPSGWTNVATATLAQEAADAADGLAGKGRAIKITAAGSSNEGISYTLSGLKDSTRYFVAALMKATSGDTAKLTTTGADATSAFRDITVTTTATAWTWLTGVVQTDATPTSLVISALAAADTDIVWVADVVWGEVSATPQATAPRISVIEQMIATTAGTAITGSTTDAGLDTNYQFVDNGTTDLDITVYVPGDGYYIEVHTDWHLRGVTSTSDVHVVDIALYESVGGGAFARRKTQRFETDNGTQNADFTVNGATTWIVKTPTPGSAYRYGLAATVSTGSSTTFQPQHDNFGMSSLTVKVLPYGG